MVRWLSSMGCKFVWQFRELGWQRQRESDARRAVLCARIWERALPFVGKSVCMGMDEGGSMRYECGVHAMDFVAGGVARLDELACHRAGWIGGRRGSLVLRATSAEWLISG